MPKIDNSLWFMVYGRKKITINYKPPTTNSFGFTLVEIITAMLIIAVIFAAAFPNLRRFNQGQELDSSVSDLIQALKLTQSNAMSNISCGVNPTDGWKIKISSTSYQIESECKNVNDGTILSPLTLPAKNYISNRVTASHSCTPTSLEIKFKGNTVTSVCSGSTTPLDSPYDIILTDSNNPANPVTIRVTSSGVITKQ